MCGGYRVNEWANLFCGFRGNMGDGLELVDAVFAERIPYLVLPKSTFFLVSSSWNKYQASRKLYRFVELWRELERMASQLAVVSSG